MAFRESCLYPMFFLPSGAFAGVCFVLFLFLFFRQAPNTAPPAIKFSNFGEPVKVEMPF